MRLGDLLNEDPRLILLPHVLRRDKAWILAHSEYEIDRETVDEFREKVSKLRRGYPVQYVLGYKEFMGLKFELEEGVFIPRYDTETLVEYALRLIKSQGIKVVADVGTGSGAIGISIAKFAGVRVFATDVSEKAVRLARRNAHKVGVSELFDVRLGEFLEPLSDVYDEIELIVSNPPYVETHAETPRELDFEPKEALFSGHDGLDFYREFFRRYDTTDKFVLMEFSGKNHEDLSELIGGRIEFLKDLDGVERFFLIRPSRRDRL